MEHKIYSQLLKMNELELKDNIDKINIFKKEIQDYNYPCIIIPYHERRKIIEANIINLLNDKNNLIIIAYTTLLDELFLEKFIDKRILKVKCSNNPLGYKFQFLVDVVKFIGIKNIVICGSDDFMTPNYVNNIYNFYLTDKNKKLLYGTNNWYIYYKNNIFKYILNSKNTKLLGSGKLLTNEFLKKFNWKIYNILQSSSIDYSSTKLLNINDYGYFKGYNKSFVISHKYHKYEKINEINKKILKNMEKSIQILNFARNIDNLYIKSVDIYSDFKISDTELFNKKEIKYKNNSVYLENDTRYVIYINKKNIDKSIFFQIYISNIVVLRGNIINDEEYIMFDNYFSNTNFNFKYFLNGKCIKLDEINIKIFEIGKKKKSKNIVIRVPHSSAHFIKKYFYSFYFNNYDNIYLISDQSYYEKYLQNAEIIILEWLNIHTKQFLNTYSKKNNQKIIVRCHDYEITSDIYFDKVTSKINFDKIDFMWFINENVKDLFFDKIKNYNKKNVFVLPNCLFDNKISKKLSFNNTLLNVSFLFSKYKNLDKILDIFEKINKSNNFKLILKGGINNSSCTTIYNNLKNIIKKQNLQNVSLISSETKISDINDKSDINRLFEISDIYINTSNKEAFGYSIAEAILYGLKPFILEWDFGGSEKIWEEHNYKTIDELCNGINDWIKLDKNIYNLKIEKYQNNLLKSYSGNILTNNLFEILKNNI